MVIDRKAATVAHARFNELPDYLAPIDLLVFNDTRVSARRLVAHREGGAATEVLITRRVDDRHWLAMLRPARRYGIGKSISVCGPLGVTSEAMVAGISPSGERLLAFSTNEEADAVGSWGSAPLPPYIHATLPQNEEERYQTVYALHPGSAAAPTAGLHFSTELLQSLQSVGICKATCTLHVGIDTFRPIKTEDTDHHEMHGEWARLDEQNTQLINSHQPGRIVAVGTTSVRTLESAAIPATNGNRVAPFCGETRLFIKPGHKFKAVDALITNFHLPRSSLVMLVSAFAGYDLTMQAYREAVKEQYRFFSFGDAMLIV
jgi:S-adenosylmethionine:tRNA ribosyltransferase-isomerase